ncbi:carbohydrate ABC transporter permease [Paracholeplasma manati]|uniref:carbohydrate ABC transporter permease n=1 Tax=Paracholeplasma manati TaxID=591373 RepID=UPI0024087955|nr:sugar ABC transporter permease [Paracholeplasma manati]MDG0888973.1 sugar ABC transporter permease [Paracholeplasma manati]
MKKHMKRSTRQRINFYLFVSPWILGFCIFSILPMLTSLYYSFTKITVLGLGRRNPEWIGMGNYVAVFTDDNVFIRSIQNTFIFSFGRVFLGIIVALLVALLMNTKIPGKRIYRTLIYLPAIIPIVGSAILWKQLFSTDFSLFNYFLSIIGIPPVEWLSYDNAMGSIIFMSIWSGLGPTMIILLAALQNVPRELIEAAKVDGANTVIRFRHITIPMVSPTIVYLLVTGFISALQAYAEMDLLTGGGPGNVTTTMAMNVVFNAFDGRGMGYASAQAWVIFAIILVFSIFFFKIINKRAYYESGDGQ